MRGARASLTSLVLLAAVAIPAAAAAQDRTATLSESDRAQARALFAAGSAAVDAGRWVDAVDSFRRAYELTGAASALFNTAFALRALGRYREAVRAFGELLEMEELSEEMRAQATSLRDEVRGRLALVRLLGLGEERHTVRVDAEAVEDTGARPLVVQADPGRRSVDVALPGHRRFEWTGALSDGQMLDLAVELLPEGPPGQPASGGSVLEEPWLWIVVGLVVLGGAGVLVWWADDQAQLRPESMMPVRL